jgi:hypothetical protein
MPCWDVKLERRRRADIVLTSTISSARYEADELPVVGDDIVVAAKRAVVTEIRERPDGQPLIYALNRMD